MPKRKIIKTPPKVSEAFAIALARGRTLTIEEEAEFNAFRAAARVEKSDSRIIATKRKKKWVFRIEGKAGADLVEHPVTDRLQKQDRDRLSELAKLNRRPPGEAAILARKNRSTVLKASVLRRLHELQHLDRKATSVVAQEFGLSAGYVQRIKAAAKRT